MLIDQSTDGSKFGQLTTINETIIVDKSVSHNLYEI